MAKKANPYNNNNNTVFRIINGMRGSKTIVPSTSKPGGKVQKTSAVKTR